jgi:inosine-uridine nucleoside N-ribohydrolase
MQRFIIDTDPGADDAIALMMALRHAGIQVEAIATVAGNVPAE